MSEPRRFAEGTSVSAEKSRAELEELLRKHGAQEFALYTGPERSIFQYRTKDGRMVRHVVEYPEREHVRTRRHSWKTLPQAEVAKLRDAEWRRRWRALVLVVKAKLEIIASGGSTFEREFLADVLLPNGDTVGDSLLPKLEEAYRTGAMPSSLLLLGAGSTP